ncbi:MAG: O-antigen ligase family protein [Planctomycetota bacterium]
MPLNIGIDDLFICGFFICTVIRRNMMEGVRPQFGYSTWAAFLFFIILVTSNVNGYFVVGREDLDIFTKGALKGAITLLLTYSLVNTIDDLEDLKRVIFSFCFFAGMGAVLVILQNYFPVPMQIFGQPLQFETVMAGHKVRPSGAFQNPNNAAVVMGAATMIIVSTLSLQSRHFNKIARFTCLGIMALAVLLTKSRSGFLSLIIPLALMGVMGKSKRYAWMFLCLGTAIIMALAGIREALFERFVGAGGQTGFVAPIALRFEEVSKLWKVIFGQSMHADIMQGNIPPHNSYLGIPLLFGIFGAIWVIAVVTIMLQKARFVKRYGGLSLAPYGRAVRWCLFSFALYSVVGDVFVTYYARYTFFLLAAITQRCVDIVWQNSIADDYQSHMYIDQTEPIEYVPV